MINTEILIAHIPVGKENAVSRQFLSLLLGTSDREMRKAINAARREGHVICNTQDGRGYFRSEDPADVLKQYRQNERRAKSILVQQKHLRRILKDAGMDV